MAPLGRVTRRGASDIRTSAPADTAWGQLIQSDAAGFFDLNFVSGETHYSPAWKRLLGYADADLANNYDTWLKLIHPDDSSAAPDQVGRHTHAPRRSFSVEFRMKHRRGHWVWVHCVGVQLFAPGGDLERVVGFHLDISERKEIEEQGVVAEDRLAALTEEGGLALFDLDFVTGRAWTSQAWRELVGDPVELKQAAGGVRGDDDVAVAARGRDRPLEVGDPVDRFTEDALRVLRGIRFVNILNQKIFSNEQKQSL